MKVLNILRSKKGVAFLVGVLALALRELLGLDDELIKQVVAIVTTYLIAQGVVDVSLVAAGKKRE